MKKLLFLGLSLIQLSAFATHDSLISAKYARFSMYDDTKACIESTIAWDGISTSPSAALMTALTAATEKQEISTFGMGDQKIDMNLLTQDDFKAEFGVDQDWDDFSKITVNVKIEKATALEANIFYYLILENAFNSNITKKVFINVTGAESIDGVKFPSKTSWPITKTSPVYKNIKKLAKKKLIDRDC